MLVIRQEQMAALAEARWTELLPKVAAYLRAQCPKQVGELDDPALETFIRDALRRGAGHGFAVEWDLVRFCWLAALHGERFDESCPWAREILSTSGCSPTERADMLEHHHLNYLGSPAGDR